MARPLVSVVIPVFNEVRTIDALLRRVLDGPYPWPEKEVLVIDDGSSDGTAEALARWEGCPGVRLFRHERNRGKGAAVRTGVAQALGEATIIQDADLEYDPSDYPRLIEPILRGEHEVVFGSRYLGGDKALPWTRFRCAVCLLNTLVWTLYGQWLSDEATCYKALRTSLFDRLDLRAERFELCPEMTAKLCRLGLRIVEIPISYHPRTTKEGKKIGWKDAAQAVWTLLKWRVLPFGGKAKASPPAIVRAEAPAVVRLPDPVGLDCLLADDPATCPRTCSTAEPIG